MTSTLRLGLLVSSSSRYTPLRRSSESRSRRSESASAFLSASTFFLSASYATLSPDSAARFICASRSRSSDLMASMAFFASVTSERRMESCAEGPGAMISMPGAAAAALL